MAAVHPFPARMAPELAQQRLAALSEGLELLDPMMGSGTFVLEAAARGHQVTGVDSDPLARVIASAAAGRYSRQALQKVAADIVVQARKEVGMHEGSPDAETRTFIDYWFDSRSRDELASVAGQITRAASELSDPLWCAFSRLIITKDLSVSRARDSAHSRPHRVRERASFSVLDRFEQSVDLVSQRAWNLPDSAVVNLTLGDARALGIVDQTIDAVMTSPPYLIAIDYLRGHRLSLVWMGYTVSELRRLRTNNIGSEAGTEIISFVEPILAAALSGEVSQRTRRVLGRYILDIDSAMGEQFRVLKPGGSMTYVVANATLEGMPISVEAIVRACAERQGFSPVSRMEREIPTNSRYLPLPAPGASRLSRRMRAEVILYFER